jgi:hypothetical protein
VPTPSHAPELQLPLLPPQHSPQQQLPLAPLSTACVARCWRPDIHIHRSSSMLICTGLAWVRFSRGVTAVSTAHWLGRCGPTLILTHLHLRHHALHRLPLLLELVQLSSCSLQVPHRLLALLDLLRVGPVARGCMSWVRYGRDLPSYQHSWFLVLVCKQGHSCFTSTLNPAPVNHDTGSTNDHTGPTTASTTHCHVLGGGCGCGGRLLQRTPQAADRALELSLPR